VQKTMNAAVVRAFGEPLAIEEIPVPEPGPGEVLVKVIACGVCHTDLHAAEATGAEVTVDARSPDAVAEILNATGGGAHGVLVTAVSPPFRKR
jgi:propanol-preferring alcohol dehydrogenase